MTRKSQRELEDVVERLKGRIDTDVGVDPEDLTAEDRQRLRRLFRSPRDLGDVEREHLENIQRWREEERREGVDRPEHGLTPAEKALYELLLADEPYDGSPDVTLPAPYWERFPDAPGGAGRRGDR